MAEERGLQESRETRTRGGKWREKLDCTIIHSGQVVERNKERKTRRQEEDGGRHLGFCLVDGCSGGKPTAYLLSTNLTAIMTHLHFWAWTGNTGTGTGTGTRGTQSPLDEVNYSTPPAGGYGISTAASKPQDTRKGREVATNQHHLILYAARAGGHHFRISCMGLVFFWFFGSACSISSYYHRHLG